jgi:hypothetical protein
MVKVAVVFALGQAAFTLVLLTYHPAFTLLNLIDVVLLAAFAAAIVNRHLWAGCCLAAYAVLDYIYKLAALGRSAWIIPPIVYVIGAISLHRTEHVAPSVRELRWKRALWIALFLVAGNFAIGFVFGFFGLTKAGVPVSVAASWLWWTLCTAWAVALFAWASWKELAWPFEAAVLIVSFSLPLGALIDLPTLAMRSALTLAALGQCFASALFSAACGMVGIGITLTLRRLGAKSPTPNGCNSAPS